MTDHKFTDEEVIKALEHCGSCYKGDVGERCTGCPLDDADDPSCFDTLLHDLSLDLINRQKAEIESLNSYIRRCKSGDEYWVKCLIERPNEAVKEFAERLKERAYTSSDWSHGEHPQVVECDEIDDLVEEMTEEKK